MCVRLDTVRVTKPDSTLSPVFLGEVSHLKLWALDDCQRGLEPLLSLRKWPSVLGVAVATCATTTWGLLTRGSFLSTVTWNVFSGQM